MTEAGTAIPFRMRLLRQWQQLGPRAFFQKALTRLWVRIAEILDVVMPPALAAVVFRLRVGSVDAMNAGLERITISPWLLPKWVRQFDEATRADVLRRAERVLAHQFDLLGSGPSDLGPRIDWLTDFKTGRLWRVVPWRRVPISLGDGSDIKVVWELNRFQHLPLLGQAWWLTGDRRYATEFCQQIESWLRTNPVSQGPNWCSPMDIAIRVVNWLYGAWAFQDAGLPAPFWSAFWQSCVAQGLFIERHLEHAEVHGNHYLANLIGLLYLGAVLGDRPEGRRWWQFAKAEIAAESEHQVQADGTANEGSIAYHRLVTECFVAADALADHVGDPFPLAVRRRVQAMVAADHALLRPDGRGPAIGDADDGRLHVLSDYGAWDPADHRHLHVDMVTAVPPPCTTSRAFANSGFYVLRADDLQVTVHCGPVGMGGRGPHSHCDQLAFELCDGAEPLIIDPGTWVYTAHLEGRAQFRSTAYHATVRVDGVEQNPFEADQPFVMADRTQARCLDWSDDADTVRFVGRHAGYARLAAPVFVERSLTLHKGERRLEITDRLTGDGEHRLEWFFPLPKSPYHLLPDGSLVVVGPSGPRLHVIPQGDLRPQATMLPGEWSPRYGRRQPAMRLCYTLEGTVPVTVTFSIQVPRR